MNKELTNTPRAHPELSILTPTEYDNAIRWKPGERLYDLFERRCEELERCGRIDHPAIETEGRVISYGELRQRVAQVAEHLIRCGIGPGRCVGLLLDRSIAAYVALLAVVKTEAAYVPLDLKFPADRIAFIAEDAQIATFIAVSQAVGLIANHNGTIIPLDDIQALIDTDVGDTVPGATAPRRAKDVSTKTSGREYDDCLSYIIYTSGSTGRPKGVAVNHSSICNFVIVAAEVYGYTESDRVYQGLTFAFDFSVEELWVPLLTGATLVASSADIQLVGSALRDFLLEHNITALCCVPTLLATIEEDVPTLRFLLVSGEACPQDIVNRWYHHKCRMLNAYGPTEATVTATWTELQPDQKVTIGIPLPTYSVAILDPEMSEVVPLGQTGEIAIGGIGLAEGYVNRDDLTAARFVPDFLHVPNNPSRRLYRTGDLGRINEDGEIEYLGRIDTQVKIKGYRIELAEIEEVLLEADGVAQAVVTVWEPTPGKKELVGYYSVFDDAAAVSRATLFDTLRQRLPLYMVPAYLEPLETIPLLASQKADRKALSPPALPRMTAASGPYVAPETPTEAIVASTLAAILGIEKVSIDDKFFEQLGLDSLRVAEFLWQLNPQLPGVTASIMDVYLSPTVRAMAATIDRKQAVAMPAETAPPAYVASTFSYTLCGTLQAISYLVLFGLYTGLAIVGYQSINGAQGVLDLATRSLAFSAASLLFLSTLPVIAKWLLIGRFKTGKIKLWSLDYFRFWLARLMVESSPLAAFRGSPLFNIYLRLLGAKIGANVLIQAKAFPLCTDIIDIGDNAILRKQCHVTGYRAENGYIYFGEIRIGRDAIVGDGTLVDLNTKIGDGAQLAHASALLEHQSIADGCRAHGSPAEATETDFAYLPSGSTSVFRRAVYGIVQAVLLTVYAGIFYAVAVALISSSGPAIGALQARTPLATDIWIWAFEISLTFFVASYVLGFVMQIIGCQALNRLLAPGKIYPLYGVHYFIGQSLATLSNSASFHTLFGDSSFIVNYLRALGYRQPNVRQTGSNFGTSLFQDNPFACEIGSGTMVSDGLFLINHEVSASAFRVSEARVGAESFIGNNIFYLPNSRVGDNCLFASKVMLPITGPTRSNVGLLGSPAFEIPREVPGRGAFDPIPTTPAGEELLRRKDTHNLATMALYLASQWLIVFIVTLMGFAATATYQSYGYLSILLFGVAVSVLGVSYYIGLEWLSLGGRKLEPHACTIHDPYYSGIERHWKLGENWLKSAFRGTPFRPIILRWLGVDMGKRVFDDGSVITEKTLVKIGDDTCINADVSIQAHSLEDGLFKSAPITIGRACSIGPLAYVHYGVTIDTNTCLASDAFLMKGTRTDAYSRWAGNPAKTV